jgi:hypothetical protein
MATRQSTDDKLDALDAAAAGADAESLPSVLSQGLKDKHYRVVALAAYFAGDKLVYRCVPDLLAAYARSLTNPVKRDPNCLAKKATIRALVEVAELLTDSEPPVRAGAARAIARGNPREAELLLRSKVLAGGARLAESRVGGRVGTGRFTSGAGPCRGPASQ